MIVDDLRACASDPSGYHSNAITHLCHDAANTIEKMIDDAAQPNVPLGASWPAGAISPATEHTTATASFDATARMREALDNSQSLLAMIHQIGPNGDLLASEDVPHLVHEQIVANRDALAAPQPASRADRTAWLLELNDTGSPRYFQISDDDDWTKDHDGALQLATKEAAEKVIAYYGWTTVKAIEHMWCEPRATQQPKQRGEM